MTSKPRVSSNPQFIIPSFLMSLDLTTIPFSEIKPNSLLVVRLPPEDGLGNAEQICRAMETVLRPHLPNSTRVLIMKHGTEVFSVDEEVMNAMGWVRANEGVPRIGMT
jgi:hypothetical protein